MMNITIIENEEEFLAENPKRDMSKIEIYGAIYSLGLLLKNNYMENDIDYVDDMSYYCNKALNVQEGLIVNDLVIDSVFMLGKNKEDLFAYVFTLEELDEDMDYDLRLARIS